MFFRSPLHIVILSFFGVVFFIIYFFWNSVPEYKLLIDPGHGGANIIKNGRPIKSDRWDPITRRYLSYYLSGMQAGTYYEHLVMLSLAKRLYYYLNLTKTSWGWQHFEKILHRFGRPKGANQNELKEFNRIILNAKMTRNDSWNMRYQEANDPDVNASYRMYDYPDQRGRTRMGRLSLINQYQPELVISLHMTPAGRGNSGGMAAVLAPGYKSYDMVRRIHLKELDRKKWLRSYWNGKILGTEAGWNQFELMRADAWAYFHGYRSNRKGTKVNFNAPRGIRHNLITWAYKQSPYWYKAYNPSKKGPYALNYRDFDATKGLFWDRERGKAEEWRREGGKLLYGGDNHYASDELLRFVQHGVRLLRPKMRKKGKIGKIHPPFASAYTLPIYVNAIVAYLEIGYLNRKRDRDLIIKEQDAVAQSLAVGIYSLYRGIELHILSKKSENKTNDSLIINNPWKPRTQAIDFKKYRQLPNGNYFRVAN